MALKKKSLSMKDGLGKKENVMKYSYVIVRHVQYRREYWTGSVWSSDYKEAKVYFKRLHAEAVIGYKLCDGSENAEIVSFL